MVSVGFVRSISEPSKIVCHVLFDEYVFWHLSCRLKTMDRPMSVWDFSTPSMGLQEIGLPGLCEPENTDVQEALCVFNMPTMPTLFDHDGGTVADADATEQHHDITRQDSPRQRVRRSASMEQKQASNREHQRRFRERSKVTKQGVHTSKTGQNSLWPALSFNAPASTCSLCQT